MAKEPEKQRKTVKCEGRFGSERDYLTFLLPTILEGKTIIGEPELRSMWNLGGDEIIYQGDFKDPYYDSRIDGLRKKPVIDTESGHLSLVPLIESPPYHLEPECVRAYASSMGNSEVVSKRLMELGRHPRKFFREVLKKEPSNISIPLKDGKSNINLSGFTITGDISIGTIISGGVGVGGGIRSDCPYLLGVYQNAGKGEMGLAAVIGFWAQDNEMIVAQLQSCRNANFPDNVCFGVAALRVAEEAAKGIGFKRIVVYSSKDHPLFYMHPESRGQLEEELTMFFDMSAKKLGYEGTRHQTHVKHLM